MAGAVGRLRTGAVVGRLAARYVLDDVPRRVGIGEVRHAVRAHALRVRQRLLPGGGAGGPGVQRRIVNELLRLAMCMRAHGEPNFPDPTVSSAPSSSDSVSLPGNITLGLGAAGISVSSPRFQAAARACRSLTPSGLFSGARAGQ